MDNRAIGVFDSGIGGLTVAAEIKKILPDEKIIYFGDTARVPYGTRSRETIKMYARQDAGFLLKNSVKAIVAACGTVSSVAFDDVCAVSDVPVYGVTRPAAEYVAKKYPKGRIGVLGTPATVSSGSFANMIHEVSPECEVVSVACPMFVPLVEYGETEGEATKIIAEKYIARLGKVDAVILGCTHFPMLTKVIAEILPATTEIVNAGECAAKVIRDEIEKCEGASQEDEYYVSDMGIGTGELAGRIMGRSIQLKVASAED